MAGDSSIGLRSKRPLVSLGVTRHRSSRARTVARDSESASGKAGPRRVPVWRKASMSGPACCVGIDVAKATLECAILPKRETRPLPNEDAAFADVVARRRALAPERIVLESTGGFEHGVVAAL